MAKRNNIPEEVRYDFATKQAYTLLNSMGFISLPVDPFAIIKYFGWKAYTVEEAEECGVKCPIILNGDMPAVKIRVNHPCEYIIIYYNEPYLPRLRWTLAHEIGHIILGHQNEFPCRLTKAEYLIAEKEADKFAAELLAPTKILNSDMFPKSLEKVIELCNISNDAAGNRLGNWNGIASIHATSNLTREGEELYRNMYNYLLEISNYWNNRLKEADINLPQQYEDYIFCDYWEYVKSRMKREHKALLALIDNSVVFYDNKDMVLFVANSEAASIDNSQKKCIIESLTKYANSPINDIVSVQLAA